MKTELKVKLLALSITTLLVICAVIKNNVLNNNQRYLQTSKIYAYETYNNLKVYDIGEDLDNFILNNQETFDFYTNIFGISIDDLKENILLDNEDKVLDYHNIGNSNIEYDSLDKNLIDYLFNLKKNNPKLFKQDYVSGRNYSKDYIYGLINYFANIYGNVDYEVLASIAYIESGNLNAKYMVSVNNIYGGMSSNGLIKYQNIEYGVLSYVKLMSEKYYGRGLNTVEKIASRYNPGSQTWVGNVKSQIHRFENNSNISLNDLITMK